MNELDPIIDSLLSFDAVAEAEKLCKNDPYLKKQGTSFALHVANSQFTKAVLTDADDTVFFNKLERYVRILEEEGFIQVLNLPFEGKKWKPEDNTRIESFQIWFHPDGILLRFDTYGVNYINGASFYFNLKLNENAERINGVSSSGSGEDRILSGYMDAREALRYNIRQLRENGVFLNPWVNKPWIWLLHYMDTKGNYNHKAINQERIALLPEYVQKAIQPEPLPVSHLAVITTI